MTTRPTEAERDWLLAGIKDGTFPFEPTGQPLPEEGTTAELRITCQRRGWVEPVPGTGRWRVTTAGCAAVQGTIGDYG